MFTFNALPGARRGYRRGGVTAQRLQRAALMLSLSLAVPAAFATDFETTVRLASERSPMLQARAAAVQAALSLQTSASQLPDPKLMLGVDSLPVNGPNRWSLTRDDFTQRQIGLAQDIPNRGKRSARAELAAARTEKEQLAVRTERLRVRRETGSAWLALHFAEKKIALFEATQLHHGLLLQTAPSQLAAGKINAADVAALRLEALTLEDRRDELLREASQARSALQRWTGLASEGVGSEPTPRFTIDSKYLANHLGKSPEIVAVEPLRALAQAELREAEAEKSGDWAWSATYGKRGPGYGDLLSVQLTFDLPVSPAVRQQPLIASKLQELSRLDAEQEDLQRQQAEALASSLGEVDELQSKLRRIERQTRPLAAEKISFTLAAYQAGRDSLAALLEARKQQTELELRALDLSARQTALQWRLTNLLLE